MCFHRPAVVAGQLAVDERRHERFNPLTINHGNLQ
jgi:hypothetical protein